MAIQSYSRLKALRIPHAGRRKLRLKVLRTKKRAKPMATFGNSNNINMTSIADFIEEKVSEQSEEEVSWRKDSIEDLKNILASVGFRQYLEDPVLGLSKSNGTVTYALLSIARFLSWTHQSIINTPLELNNDAVQKWTKTVISRYPSIVLEFQKFLIKVLLFSADTVIAFISRLKEYVEWFRTFRISENADSFRIKLSKYNKFVMMCNRVMKGARKLRSKQSRKNSGSKSKSLDEAIMNRQLPQGGLKELQDAVSSEMDWVRAFSTSVRRGPGLVDEVTYQRLLRLLVASIYVFAPQGRISGVQDMQVKDVENLYKSFATSSEFKTSSTYGIQAVTLGDVSKEILSVYTKYFRPRVVTARPFPNDPLFVTFNGLPDKRLGRHLTAFFQAKLGLNITTTLIRSLVETTVDTRYRNGEITLDQREAVSAISGHSSKIVKEHYLRLNIAEQLEKAKIAIGMSDSETAPSATFKEPIKLRDWGTSHPQYGDKNPNARIKFSEEEDAYLLDLAQDMMRTDGTLPERFTSLALKAIKDDPDSTAIFHLRHVFSADRLRARFRYHNIKL